DLFRRALGEAGRPGTRAVKVNLPVPGNGKAAQAARWALTQQLKPYVWGAAGPSSYDCSGLVMAAYRRVGISLPHYTGDQWTAGRHISREELRPGDLVFFYSDLHHVGTYLGAGMMVHAPRTGDVVRIASINGRPYAGAVRIADGGGRSLDQLAAGRPGHGLDGRGHADPVADAPQSSAHGAPTAVESPPHSINRDALGKLRQQRQICMAQFDIFTEHIHREPSPPIALLGDVLARAIGCSSRTT